MFRWTLTVLTAALLAVWLPSGRWGAQVVVGADPYVGLFAYKGAVTVGFSHKPPIKPEPALVIDVMDEFQVPYELVWAPAWSVDGSAGAWIGTLTLPIWFCALATGAPAGLLWGRHRRARRREQIGKCGACGYDLAGLEAEDGALTCPECGAGSIDKPQGADQQTV